jgi:phosphoacetylglucosamine mutase
MTTSESLSSPLSVDVNSSSSDSGVVAIEWLLQVLHDQPLSSALSYYEYGTAGFRFQASWMDGLMVRVGMIAILLQLQPLQGQVQVQQDVVQPQHLVEDMGIMITASHNDESYNGVKLSNPDGSMLTPIQEEFIVQWVNETNINLWRALLMEYSQLVASALARTSVATTTTATTTSYLHIGRDTRSHSPHLAKLCIDGANAMIAAMNLSSATSRSTCSTITLKVNDHGIVTTPMLHHIVLHSNPCYLPQYITPAPTRQGYVQTFAKAYVEMCQLSSTSSSSSSSGSSTTPTTTTTTTIPPPRLLHVDGACGVGYQALVDVSQAIQELFVLTLTVDEVDASGPKSTTRTSTSTTIFVPHNGPEDGPLNDHCGSEHVQKQLSPPIWYDVDKNKIDGRHPDEKSSSTTMDYCCALDGDADRIVFFGQDNNKSQNDNDDRNHPNQLTQLLDGDKIAILIGHVVATKLKEVYKNNNNNIQSDVVLPHVTMGIVQTAYANGASTEYVRVRIRSVSPFCAKQECNPVNFLYCLYIH